MTTSRAAVAAAAFFLSSLPLHAQQRHFPDTSDGIHVFSDQIQSGMTLTQHVFAALELAGCQKIFRSDAENIRLFNRDFIVLHYQLGCGNGQAYFIDGDEWVSDWNYVNVHESWFMHEGGQRLRQTAWDWYLMNISQGGYRDYWADSCIERMRNGDCDGVFADSFTVDAYFDQLVPAHPWFTDTTLCIANWIPRLEVYADYIQARLAATPERFSFIPNLGALVTSWDTTTYAELGDGGMVEGFAAWGDSSYFDLADWRLQMDRILDLVRRDKIVICQSYASDENFGQRMFLIGCYLLIKGTRTYVNMIPDGAEELWYHAEYEISIGTPIGSLPGGIDGLFDASSGCYRRDYSNGIVLVNPGPATVGPVPLGAAYQLVSASGGGPVNEAGSYGGALSYLTVESVELPPHSAAILVRELPFSMHTVTLGLDKPVFRSDESLVLHWGITPAPSPPLRVADAYVAAMTPWGKLYFYSGAFGEKARPIARSMAVRELSGSLGPFPLAGLPAGVYTWYAVLVGPGGNPLSVYQWASNLADAPFTLE
jgi:hypothetical protein